MSRPAIVADLPATVGPYSSSSRVADLLFLSGQVGKQPGTTTVSGSVADQTAACLQNLRTVLEHNGLDLSALVKCNVYLVDMNDLTAMNAAYESVLGELRPARTTIGVLSLPLGARVEIEAIAAVHPD